eukprot:TRINITY_DN390_c14_g1_i1.p1 TRINITY_DN390_c14_g1~~TRINITY_DN390_c14_g1_i1.p1  ORF type:complete len:344 (+),score=72.54 TRINITY_DN390_c14_g1_i1:49-1032(+)
MNAKITIMLLSVGCMAEGELISVGDRAADLLQNAPPVDTTGPDWCQADVDCTRQGDTSATCEESNGVRVCQCTLPFVGEICYEQPTTGEEFVGILGYFVATFPDADCSQFKSIIDAISTFDNMFDQIFVSQQTFYLCGSISMVVQAPLNAVNISSQYTKMINEIHLLASNEKYTTALGYDGTISSIKTSFHPDPGPIPTCIVLNAQQTIIVEGVCRALVCNPGYVPFDEFVNGKVVPSCELDTEGDDAALTDSAVAGIIFGILLLAAIVGFIIWHFTCRDDGEDGIPVNDPYNESPPSAVSEATHEPYGRKKAEEEVEDISHDDIAV